MTDPDPWLVQFNEKRRLAKEAEKSFEVEGETIYYKPFVAPEVGLRRQAFQDKINAYVEIVAEAQASGKPIPEMGVDNETMLAISESVIYDCLAPESFKTWEKLRDPKNPEPLGLLEIWHFSGFILSKVTNLPTDAPPASSNGHQGGARTSRAGSSSRAAARKR